MNRKLFGESTKYGCMTDTGIQEFPFFICHQSKRGPVIPAPVPLKQPVLWNKLTGEDYKSFSESAVYNTTFPGPAVRAKYFLLNPGKVSESARVTLNGEYYGTLLGPDFSIVIPAGKIKKTNRLEIRVTNLAANRIAYLDRKGIEWKKFYNPNFPSRLPQNRKEGLFDASAWSARPSGMEGPVTLTPVKHMKPLVR